MKNSLAPSVSLVGAGNVASHLGVALKRSGIKVRQVWSRTITNGKRLARLVDAGFVEDLESMRHDVDLIIISVPDEAIPDAIRRIGKSDILIVHTSGSLPAEVLSAASDHIGVLYPVQTFRKGVRMSFSRIPICIEAPYERDRELLFSIAQQLSTRVVFMNAADRQILHLAAVFACNFSNYMYVIAGDLLNKHDIPFDLLQPLIRKTAANANTGNPFSRQTGPAVRGDLKTISHHFEMLQSHPEYRSIYEEITHLIRQQIKKNGKL